MLKLRKNKKGFTLVELIVVIAIMAVLAGTVAGVTVSQLNKQTNNTAKSEATTFASDLRNFMIDYKLSAPESGEGTWNAGDKVNSIPQLKHAVNDFITENSQTNNVEVVALEANATAPEENDDIDNITGLTNDYEAGDHKFYAFVYSVTEDSKLVYKVRFCCKQKGNGKNQFPFADYTYSDSALTD